MANEKNLSDKAKEMAKAKGFFLHIGHDCTLLIKNEDAAVYPQPNLRFNNLSDVVGWLECQKT